MPIPYLETIDIIDRKLDQHLPAGDEAYQRLYRIVGNSLKTKIQGLVANQLIDRQGRQVDGNDIQLSRPQIDDAIEQTQNDFTGTDIEISTLGIVLDVFFQAIILEYYNP